MADYKGKEPLEEIQREDGGKRESLPDQTIGFAERNAYGYMDNMVYPLTKARAIELWEKDLPILLLYPDNTEAYAESMEDIIAFDGIFGIEKVRGILVEKEGADELAFRVGDRYLSIHVVDDGYDYSFHNQDYVLLDGGVYDNPEISISQAVKEILELEEEELQILQEVDYEELEEDAERANAIQTPLLDNESKQIAAISNRVAKDQALNQMSCADIEETVLAYAQSKVEDQGYAVQVMAARVYGSRMVDCYSKDSDLDVVIEYQGDIREDVFFDMLHEDGLSIGGMKLDINPVTADKSGTIEEYLAKANKQLDEKIKGAREITGDKEMVEVFTQESKPTVSFFVAECMEFADLREYHENLTMEEAIRLYESIPAERMSGIKGIGFTLHEAEDKVYKDSTMAILNGNTIDVDTINCVDEFRDNPFIQEAIKEVIQKFPDAEVWDKETRVREHQEVEKMLRRGCMNLSVEIDQFCEDYDTYEYRDAIDSKEENMEHIYASLYAGEDDGIKEWLQSVVEEEEPVEDIMRAKEILKNVNDFEKRLEQNLSKNVTEMEKSNDAHMDGILNHMKPKEGKQAESSFSIMEMLKKNQEKVAKKNRNGKGAKEVAKKSERGIE